MTTDNTTTTQDTTVDTVKKFVLKFDLSAYRPSVVCESTGFYSELIGDYKFSNVVYVKNLLVKNFIAREESADYDNKQQQQQTIWVYDMNNATNTTTVYRAPRIIFWPCDGDFKAMQTALTSSKISATFFDSQIVKHMQSVGIPATRENVRAYRNSYKSEISKLLKQEILDRKSTATVARHFDKINGNSYFSVNLSNGIYQINVPAQYGYGDAKGLIIRALKLDVPRNIRSGEYLDSLGITVVDNGYSLKRDMFQAAFHI